VAEPDTDRAPNSAFGSRNFRLVFAAQLVSMPGTFVQTAAQAWLVLAITHSARLLGLAVGLQFLPMLVLGAPAGVLIDRLNRQRLYLTTQSVMSALALTLGILTVAGVTRFWVVAVFAVALGSVTALDQSTKTALTLDLVGRALLRHAVGLTNALANSGRVVGPPIAALCINTLGTGACFIVNALSFIPVIAVLSAIRVDRPVTAAQPMREDGGFRAGLRYVRSNRELFSLLLFAGFLCGSTWQYDVTLPLVARMTFKGGPGTLAVLSSALSIGAVVSALCVRRLARVSSNVLMMRAACTCAAGTALTAVSPAPAVAAAFLFVTGASVTTLVTSLSARLQLGSRPEMRGRVVALWTVAVLGTRPIGGPLCGVLAGSFGARWALALGVTAPLALWVALRAQRVTTVPELDQLGAVAAADL